jgi:hypothetical protein
VDVARAQGAPLQIARLVEHEQWMVAGAAEMPIVGAAFLCAVSRAFARIHIEETGKRVSRLNPDSGWIVQNVAALRIIDQDLWERVKTRQGALKISRSVGDGPGYWDRRRPRYLFTGLMHCAVCGSGIVHFNKVYIGCANVRNKGTCNNKATMRREVLESAVLDGLQNRLMETATGRSGKSRHWCAI